MKGLLILFFFFTVQSFFMFTVGLKFFSIEYKTKQLIYAMISYSISIWFIREIYIYFHIPFGTHTLFLFVFFCIILKILFKLEYQYILSIALLSFSFIMLGSSLAGILSDIIKLDPNVIISNTWLYLIFGNIENIVLIIFYIFISFFNLNISKLIKSDQYL